MKTFEGDFNKLKDKLEKGEHFGFARFSDGELYVMGNVRLEIGIDHYQIGEGQHSGTYGKEEMKSFIPGQHDFYRQKLIDSLQFRKSNYYKGISCRCCVGQQGFDYQLGLHGGDDESLTWSNLFINGNYPKYVEEIVPIFKTKKIVMIVNESANLQNLGFDIVKDFRVGSNCFVNDYHLIEEVGNWIRENNIKDHLFLVSAASLSNLLIHQLYKEFDQNTYMDIGSSLNPLMDMQGWRGSRTYLLEYWEKTGNTILNQKCIW
jgi:hypothetical protein